MLLLKEILEGKLELSDELVETLFQCTTCAACAHQCPSGVNVPEIIKAVRRDMVHIGTCHPAFKGMDELLTTKDNIYAEDERPDFGRKGGRRPSTFTSSVAWDSTARTRPPRRRSTSWTA